MLDSSVSTVEYVVFIGFRMFKASKKALLGDLLASRTPSSGSIQAVHIVYICTPLDHVCIYIYSYNLAIECHMASG